MLPPIHLVSWTGMMSVFLLCVMCVILPTFRFPTLSFSLSASNMSSSSSLSTHSSLKSGYTDRAWERHKEDAGLSDLYDCSSPYLLISCSLGNVMALRCAHRVKYNSFFCDHKLRQIILLTCFPSQGFQGVFLPPSSSSSSVFFLDFSSCLGLGASTLI